MSVQVKHNQYFGYPFQEPEFPLGELVRFANSDDNRIFVVRGIFFSKKSHKWLFEIDAVKGSSFCSEAFADELEAITPEELIA